MKYTASVLIHNNAADEILLPNGSILTVTPDTFREFLAECPSDDWNGAGDWESLEVEIMEAARHWGEPVAKWVIDVNELGYEDHELVILDEDMLERRKEFYA